MDKVSWWDARTYNTEFFQQLHRLPARTPGWCRPASRSLSRNLSQRFDTFLQHITLLLLAQRRHELVSVAMQPDFVALLYDLSNLGWK